MLTETQEKWVQALESGEYKQCADSLHVKGKGYCCLGVACQVILGDPEGFNNDNQASWDGLVRIAPPSVVKALGLIAGDGAIDGPCQYASLADANDDGKTFKEIAAFIRANPGRISREVEQ